MIDELIDKNKSALVPGRLINDNLILSNKLIKGYGRKRVSPRCSQSRHEKGYDSIQ